MLTGDLPCAQLSVELVSFHLYNCPLEEVFLFNPILQMQQIRPREVKRPSQEHGQEVVVSELEPLVFV